MQKRWDKLTLCLRAPGAPLDNDVCERALKKVILNRKNALFYKTENGAKVGDIFMSLIHTAELAGGDPAQWLPWNCRATLDQTKSPSPTST